jgi:hypothetical protein
MLFSISFPSTLPSRLAGLPAEGFSPQAGEGMPV